MKTGYPLLILTGLCLTISACTQTTPSMMNENRAELVDSTTVDQLPVTEVSDAYIEAITKDYNRYGEGPMELTVSYDPKSKSYTAMKAVNDLAQIKNKLAQKGLHNVKTSTMPSDGAKPQLMVTYDTVTAQAPSSCAPMPGMKGYKTSRFIDDRYRFGCGIETQMARQIYRPADLKGTSEMATADGRKATNVAEYSRVVSPDQIMTPIQSFGRNDLQSGN